MAQYTIRNVPDYLDHELRSWARRKGMSLNEAALEAMKRGVGVSEKAVEYNDLDDLIGTWKADPYFEAPLGYTFHLSSSEN